jgi:hypothetical protein
MQPAFYQTPAPRLLALVICFLLLLATPLSAAFAQPTRRAMSLPETVKASRWKHRVLLLYAPTPDDADLQRQRQLLAPARAGLQERDMLVLEAVESTLPDADKSYLHQTLGLRAGAFAAVLIGKDGGVKRRDQKPVEPKTLYGTIDTMPMRREEMSRK